MTSWVEALVPHGSYRTTAQLRDLGIGAAALSRAVAGGRLHRIFPEHYARSRRDVLPPTVRHEAALSHAGCGAYLDCVSATAAWGLCADAPADVHLGAVTRRLRQVAGLDVHYHATRLPELCVRDRMLVVRRELAVVRAFGCIGVRDGQALVLGATQRGVLRPADVLPFVGRRSRHRQDLLDVLHHAAAGSHSLGELELLVHALVTAGLPPPQRQIPLVLPNGRIIHLDAGYVRPRIGLEYDGRPWHFDAAARNRDIERDAHAAAAGWVILRCTAETRRDRAQWAGVVRRTVEARGGF